MSRYCSFCGASHQGSCSTLVTPSQPAIAAPERLGALPDDVDWVWVEPKNDYYGGYVRRGSGRSSAGWMIPVSRFNPFR